MLNNHFIEPELEINAKIKQPASYVRKAFVVSGTVEKAELQISALGVYKGYLNGAELDGQVLMPGYTDYKYRLQLQSHNVTGHLRQGENVIAAVVGDGWYRGCLSIGSHRNVYGEKTKLVCRLFIRYADGSEQILFTDESWKATQGGPLRENDLKTVEKYDARMEIPGWNAPGFDDGAWHDCVMSEYCGEVVEHEGEPVLEHEAFTPAVLSTPNGGQVLDFGQNMAGHVEFSVSGRAGHTVKLTMGETLDENGNFTLKNLKAEGAGLISGELGQELYYTLKDGEQAYKSIFLISGFRYVKLENWPEPVRAENFKAIPIYADLKDTGSFECSNPLINRLVQNVNWSRRSNFVDTPTDCPTRERSGWTADISVFSETACYLTDPRRFLKKWLHDFLPEQGEDGSLPFVVPERRIGERQRSCCGWSDAIANLPTVLYQFYGDKEILEEVYPAIERYVAFNLKRAKKRNPLLLFKHGPHRKYIIETGFHYGEWLEPGHPMYKDYIKAFFLPDTEVTTAWFFHTVRQLSQMAEILGKPDDAKKYGGLAEEIRRAYYKEFTKDGEINSKRQCKYVRPVYMDLLSEEEKKRAVRRLNEMCIANGYRIGTGFLTTYRLLDVLSQYGCVDTAYKILENTERPGWLYPVTRGATTTWENWFGINENGAPVDSHNHYAPGSVVAWLFSTCAGIRPLEPGFSKILIKPTPGGTLTYAEAKYDSIRGQIVSRWERSGGSFSLHVEIPENTEAVIKLPNGESRFVRGGAHDFSVQIAK